MLQGGEIPNYTRSSTSHTCCLNGPCSDILSSLVLPITPQFQEVALADDTA